MSKIKYLVSPLESLARWARPVAVGAALFVAAALPLSKPALAKTEAEIVDITPERSVVVLPYLGLGVMNFGGEIGGTAWRPSLRLQLDLPVGEYGNLFVAAQAAILQPYGQGHGVHHHGFGDWSAQTTTEQPDEFGYFLEAATDSRRRISSAYTGLGELTLGYNLLPALLDVAGEDPESSLHVSPVLTVGFLSREATRTTEERSSLVTYRQESAGPREVTGWEGPVVPTTAPLEGVQASCYAQAGIELGYQGEVVRVSGGVKTGLMSDDCLHGARSQVIEATTAEVMAAAHFW